LGSGLWIELLAIMVSHQDTSLQGGHSISVQFIRETLVALLAMLPGGKMPDRELVVAEVISRNPG
jgi:hypothetical protein